MRKPMWLRSVQKIISHLITCASGGDFSPSSARICRRHPVGEIRPHDIHKRANSLKLRKACGLSGIPNECLRHLPGRPLVHLTHLYNRCFRLSHYPKLGREAKFITLPKPSKDRKFSHNLSPISPITVAIAHVTSHSKSPNYSSGHTAVPLEFWNSSEVKSHSRIHLYPLGKGHTQETQFYWCIV
jgi:hypothetical protein